MWALCAMRCRENPCTAFVFSAGEALGAGYSPRPAGPPCRMSKTHKEESGLKKILSLALALVLCLGLLPITALAGKAEISAWQGKYDGTQYLSRSLHRLDTSRFADWDDSAWWAISDGMEYAIGMGYLAGRANGDTLLIDATAPVTEAELIAAFARMCLSSETIASYWPKRVKEVVDYQRNWHKKYDNHVPSDEELETEFLEGKTWYETQGFGIADLKLGLSTGYTHLSDTPTQTLCSRAQLAEVVVNTMSAKGEKYADVNRTEAIYKMNDHYLFDNFYAPYLHYGNSIGVVVGSGIVRGDQNGNFNPGNTVTRAELAEVMYRLDNPQNGKEYPRNIILLEMDLFYTKKPVIENTEDPITIDMRTCYVPHRAPRKGDTVIRPDGSSVVLEIDEQTGVLGWKQNVAPYIGTYSNETGYILTGDEWVMSALENGSWTDQLALGWYMKCDVPGYEYEYHWSGEWSAIKDATSPNRKGVKGTEGQIDSTGLWIWSEAGYGSWCWRGPLNV